jgi:hypothetical protein
MLRFLPATLRAVVIFEVDADTCGRGIVKITPALVPTHSKSLQANKDVTLRQAALCCLMMSSQPANKFILYFTSSLEVLTILYTRNHFFMLYHKEITKFYSRLKIWEIKFSISHILSHISTCNLNSSSSPALFIKGNFHKP